MQKIVGNLIKNLDVGIIVISTDGDIVYVNPMVSFIFRYSEVELINMNLKVLFSDIENLTSVTDFISRIKQQVVLEDDYILRNKQNTLMYCHIKGVFDRETNIIYLYVRVVNKDQLYDEIQRIEERYQSVIKAMTEGIVIQNSSGHILDINESALRILRLTHDQIMGRTSTDPRWRAVKEDGSIFPGNEHPAMVTLQTGKAMNQVIMGVTDSSDESITWISINSVPIFYEEKSKPDAVVCTFSDITKRKKVENQLRFSQVAVDNAMNGIIVLDDQFHILMCNESFLKIFQFQGEEILSTKFTELLEYICSDDEFQRLRKNFSEWNPKEKLVGDFKCYTKTGKEIHLNLSMAPVINDKDEVEEYVLLFNDVTQLTLTQKQLEQFNVTLQKRVKDEVEKNREKDYLLIQQSRLAAMGEMMNSIANQWRQPLNVLTLQLQDILDVCQGGELDEEYVKKNVEVTIKQVNHLTKTINDFRNFFSLNQEFVTFSLNEAIENALTIVEGNLRQFNVIVNVSKLRNLYVKGFQNEFSQVIINLIYNSREAYAFQQKTNRYIDITIYEKGKYAIVEVRDYAGGIREEIINKIFDPYFSTKQSGTGLGLYLSKTIVERMKGKITVENKDDGVIFHIAIPTIK